MKYNRIERETTKNTKNYLFKIKIVVRNLLY